MASNYDDHSPPESTYLQRRIQDFKLGGVALKEIAPSRGRREICLGISCEKSRFYAKKSYLFQLRREARKFWGYFVWKITILRQKIIFSNFRGARAGCAPPPGTAPGLDFKTSPSLQSIINLCQILKFVRKKITIKKTDEFNTVRILFCSDNQWGGLEYNKCLNCTL